MSVRKMKPEDLPEVSRMIVEAFFGAVASGLSDEGVETFIAISAPEALASRMDEDNGMFVYEEHGTLVGMVELKEGRHLALLFVATGRQRQGIGRTLVQEVLRHSRARIITVNASLPSVPAYQKYGFKVAGPEDEQQGLRFIPMEIEN